MYISYWKNMNVNLHRLPEQEELKALAEVKEKQEKEEEAKRAAAAELKKEEAAAAAARGPEEKEGAKEEEELKDILRISGSLLNEHLVNTIMSEGGGIKPEVTGELG